MGNISGTTSEDFVYQSGNSYFTGRLTRKDGAPNRLVGGAYELIGEGKRYIGQINITFNVIKNQILFVMNDLDNIPELSDLTQKIVTVLK